jgi:hypothetical protein
MLLAAAPAIPITLLHNQSVTGTWWKLPEMLSQEQYGVPAPLTLQAPLVPNHPLTAEQQLGFKMQQGFAPPGGETLRTFLDRLEYRIRFYRFFVLTPLYLALPFFLTAMREYRYVWVAITLALFALGINFFPAYQHHSGSTFSRPTSITTWRLSRPCSFLPASPRFKGCPAGCLA